MIKCAFKIGMFAGGELPDPIADTSSPVVTAPNNTNFEFANGGAGLAHDDAALLALLATATATDNVDATVTVSHNLATLPNPLTAGGHTITFSATDAAGNTGTDTTALTISEAGVIDGAAPTITAPANTSFEFANGGAGLAHDDADLLALLATATATDNVDATVTVSQNLATLPNPLTTGVHTIMFSATDAAGNTGTDTTALTISEAQLIPIYGPTISITGITVN